MAEWWDDVRGRLKTWQWRGVVGQCWGNSNTEYPCASVVTDPRWTPALLVLSSRYASVSSSLLGILVRGVDFSHTFNLVLFVRICMPCPIMWKMSSSTKPEVHNILHCRQKRTEPRPQVTCTENFMKFGHVVYLCERTSWHRGRLIAAEYNTVPYVFNVFFNSLKENVDVFSVLYFCFGKPIFNALTFNFYLRDGY